MRVLGLILGGLALAAFSPAATGGADPQAAAQQAADAIRDGQPDAAERAATVALADDTLAPIDRAHALLNRALAREALSKRQDALADFNNALWLNILPPKEKARALFDRGVTLDELGRTADAIADYSAALQIEPAYAAALNNRGNAERRLGKVDEARADYEASLAAGNPQKQYPYFGLGEIATIEGDTIDAAQDYRAALAVDAGYDLAAQRLAALGPVPEPIRLHPPQMEDPVRPKPPDAPQLRLADADDRGETKLASLGPLPAGIAARPDGVTLQLGAWRDIAAAQGGWKALTARAGGALDGITPAIVAADIPGKGRYWRLRIGPFAPGRAAALCGQLKGDGQGCIAVRD